MSKIATEDALTGKFFNAYVSDEEQQRYVDPPARIIEFGGMIENRVRDGLYLVVFFIADGVRTSLVPVEKMFDWHFYEKDAWTTSHAKYLEQTWSYNWAKRPA